MLLIVFFSASRRILDKTFFYLHLVLSYSLLIRILIRQVVLWDNGSLFLRNSLIYLKSEKHAIVSHSSTKVEYRVMTSTTFKLFVCVVSYKILVLFWHNLHLYIVIIKLLIILLLTYFSWMDKTPWNWLPIIREKL